MRLLSETRSVLEYLPRLSVNMYRCENDREGKYSHFSKNARSSAWDTNKPDSKTVVNTSRPW